MTAIAYSQVRRDYFFEPMQPPFKDGETASLHGTSMQQPGLYIQAAHHSDSLLAPPRSLNPGGYLPVNKNHS